MSIYLIYAIGGYYITGFGILGYELYNNLDNYLDLFNLSTKKHSEIELMNYNVSKKPSSK